MYDIIEKKRDGNELTSEEIEFFIHHYTDGKIPDYQVSALLMAIYFQGMNNNESAHLTSSMVQTGITIDLSNIQGVKVDKHSTGGVGDTTTIILGPLVASLGVPVPKMSGRGLGHTGGTLDKLEAIDGFDIALSKEKFISLVNENKVAVIGQTEKIVPADKLLYSLRDVTATVNSIPLIASSIMSKKIASGSDAIVLDVKVGAGAFMKELADAKALAKNMVEIGRNVDKQTIAVISSMEQPLGHAVGNALEVEEAIQTLKGKGPKDLTELTLELGSHMVVLAGKATSKAEAKKRLEENLHNGKAIEVFKTFIKAQGGDERIVEEPALLVQASHKVDIFAKDSGYVKALVADEIGRAAMLLGAGRETKESTIDLAVGVIVHKKLGDSVSKGDKLFTIHANQDDLDEVEEILLENIKIADEKVTPTLIVDTIS